jgi:hypothetical protein
MDESDWWNWTTGNNCDVARNIVNDGNREVKRIFYHKLSNIKRALIECRLSAMSPSPL